MFVSGWGWWWEVNLFCLHTHTHIYMVVLNLARSLTDILGSFLYSSVFQKFYSQTLMFQLPQSSQKLPLLAQGSGLEPRLEFNPSILELGPLLPFAPGDEAEVVVKNPCHFPIEFYSLEFDQQYLLEEKVKGGHGPNTVSLPLPHVAMHLCLPVFGNCLCLLVPDPPALAPSSAS